jgi:hypothetical protein
VSKVAEAAFGAFTEQLQDELNNCRVVVEQTELKSVAFNIFFIFVTDNEAKYSRAVILG